MIGAISGYGSSYNYYNYAYSASLRRNYGASQAARTSGQEQAKPVQRAGAVVTAQRAANPELPVQPVRAAAPVTPDGSSLGLNLRQGVDPVEMAVRMRIQYAGGEDQENQAQAAGLKLPGQKGPMAAVQGESDGGAGIEGIRKTVEEGECQTCKERKYQDGSDDAGVSFKTPSHIDPDMAASAVRGHEQEHVVREQAEAGREGRKVVSQSVSIHTDICPECGRVYVSGGTTRTTTAAADQKPQQQAQEQEKERQVRAPFSAVA